MSTCFQNYIFKKRNIEAEYTIDKDKITLKIINIINLDNDCLIFNIKDIYYTKNRFINLYDPDIIEELFYEINRNIYNIQYHISGGNINLYIKNPMPEKQNNNLLLLI